MAEDLPSRVPGVAARLLMVGAATLVGILLGEIALRAVDYNEPIWYQPDRQLGWALRPGVAAWMTKEGRAHVAINASGWRDQDHALDKPMDTLRIAVLGDSYVEAGQVAQEETFWARLPQQLARCDFGRGKRIETLAFGASGYGTAQEYLALKTQAMRYQPDVVLLMFTNGNDVRNNSKALDDEQMRPFFVADQSGELQLDDSFTAAPEFTSRSSLQGQVFRKAVDLSRVAQLLNTARNLPLTATSKAQAGPVRKVGSAGAVLEQGLEPDVLAPPRDSRWEEAWRISEKLIAKSAEHAHSKAVKFLVVTIPYAIQVHPDAAVRADLQGKLGVPDLFYPDRRIKTFTARHDIQALALAPPMQHLAEQQQLHFHGFANSGMGQGHWNADGHRVAAELIAGQLCGDMK